MIDQLISTLKAEAMPQLMSKFGLSDSQADKSVVAAADSVKEVVTGGNGLGLDDLMGLFGQGGKGSGTDAILSQLGGVMQGKLTGQAGLDAGTASSVKDMLLPLVMNLISKQVGGDSSKLQGLLGGLGGGDGLASAAKGMLGKLFK